MRRVEDDDDSYQVLSTGRILSGDACDLGEIDHSSSAYLGKVNKLLSQSQGWPDNSIAAINHQIRSLSCVFSIIFEVLYSSAKLHF